MGKWCEVVSLLKNCKYNMHTTGLKSVTLVSFEVEWSHCAFWPEGKKLGTYSPLFKRSGWDFSVNPPPFIRLVGTFLNQPQPLVLEQYCCWWWWSFRFQINPGSSYSATTPQNYNSFSIYMVLQMDLAFTWGFVNFTIFIALPTSGLIESQAIFRKILWHCDDYLYCTFYQKIVSL